MADRIRQIDSHEEQHDDAETRKRDTRVIPAPVIAPHAVQQHEKGYDRPSQLPEKKIGARYVVLQLGNER